MTISSSLNAGVAGLASNASRLAAISDNIANSATHGYKRVESDFHSMVVSSGGGNYSAGGVRVTSHRLIDQSGSLVATTNATDLAVRGRGFLPVTRATDVEAANGESQMLLTTTGSFRTDSNGYLRTESGLMLLGWPALPDGTVPTYPRDTADGLEPVQINVNQFSGEPTTMMSLGVNLLMGLTKRVAAALDEAFDIEVVEAHHRHKVDAPRGPALLLGEAAAAGRSTDLADNSETGRDGITGARTQGAIGFASLRGGSVAGDHSVILASEGESITLSHRAEDRSIFARGAVKAALWLVEQGKGRYDMKGVLRL